MKALLINIKQQILFIFISVILLALVIFRAKLFTSYWTTWASTQWLIDYGQGFVKRGLLGELLGILSYERTIENITALHNTLLVIGLSWLVALFLLPALKRNMKGLQLFGLLAITSSATLQHFIFDSPRFDIVLLTLLLLSLTTLIICKHRLIHIVCIPLILAIGLLVHEASFFIIIPTVITFWVYQSRDQPKGWITPAMSFLLLLGLTFLISQYGVRPEESLVFDFDKLVKKYDWAMETSYNVVYYSSLEQNIQRTLKGALKLDRLASHILMLLLLICIFRLFWPLIKQLKAQTSLHERLYFLLLIAASFSPLLLYPLGHDHFRWWSFSLTNFFIIIAILAIQSTNISWQLAHTFEQKKRLAYFVIAASLFVGPIAATTALGL